MIKTKIIATVGPASAEAGILKDLLDAGVDVFRLNFSHGTIEQHAELLNNINSVRVNHDRTTALMGDLCGPKGIVTPWG